jgi:hypothetical protein
VLRHLPIGEFAQLAEIKDGIMSDKGCLFVNQGLEES